MESPIKVFSDWVISGKDEGMQKGHSPAVKNMLEYSTKELTDYSFIDAGCGNGWVVRNIGSDPKCNKAIGVDGSLNMIEKAKKLDRKNQYFCNDLMNWSPNKKVNIVIQWKSSIILKDPINLSNMSMKTGCLKEGD
jgi:trans-aconitate methyltransferase